MSNPLFADVAKVYIKQGGYSGVMTLCPTMWKDGVPEEFSLPITYLVDVDKLVPIFG